MQDIGLYGNQGQQNPHPVCVVGVGEGVGLDPYLSMAISLDFIQDRASYLF